MQVKDLMTHDVEVVRPDTPLREAAEKMRSLNVGVMPVCDGRKLRGMLTDRDITVRATALGRDPNSTTAGETMTPDVVYCYDDQDVREAAELMQQLQIRRIPIVNRDNELVGIVSLGDLAVDHGSDTLSGQVIEDISQPSRPER
jgi:CBS domain-containing protein